MIFFLFLAANLPSTDDGDSMRWKLTKNGDFNIRLFYHKLRGSSSIVFPRKVFGRLKHPGVSLSLFGQSHGIGFSRMIICEVRVLILLIGASCVVVVGRQWIICCYIVGRLIFLLIKKKKKKNREKAHHLWSFVFSTFGISWVISRLVIDFLSGWWSSLGEHSSNIWNLAQLCLMWCKRRERNRRTFKDLDRSDDQLLAFFSSSLFDWSRA